MSLELEIKNRLRGALVVDVGSGPGSRIDGASQLTLEEMGPRGIIRADRDFRVPHMQGQPIRCDLNYPSLPFSDGCFEAAVCMHVLEHVRDPSRLLSEIHRIVRSGSLFLVAVPNGWSFSDNLYKLWKTVFLLTKGEPQPHIQRFRRRQLEQLIEAAGFRIREISLIGESYTWLSRHPRAQRVLTKLTQSLARIHRPTFSYGWHIAAERI